MISDPQVLSVEGDRLRMPSWAWDHDGFRRWLKSPDFPSDVRASFVRGEVFIEMSPEKLESHNKVKTAITAALERIVQDEDLGEVYSDRTLLSHPEAGLSTEPDLLFASWSTLESGKLSRIRSADGDDYIELEGSPDLVVEIVSDSSQRKDRVELRAAYARAKIPEYWIIDARAPEIEFQVFTLGRDGYEAASSSIDQQSPVLGRHFVLRRERNRIGNFRYRLEVAG